MAASSKPGAAAPQMLFFLRFIQQGSLVLTGFVTAYFIYWHAILLDPIPAPLILLLSACTLTLLELYLTTALTLSSTTPNYMLLLKTSTPFSILLGIGYYMLRQMKFVRSWCEGDNWFRPIRESEGGGYTLKPAGVEEHHCALICVVVVAGAVALGVTVLVSVFASVGVMRERKMRRKGYAVLGEEIDDADDAESCTQEDFEKM